MIVLLHGGGDLPGNQFGFHLFARRCRRAGFNAATFEMPYHFRRRPRQYGRLEILCQYGLISRDYLQVATTILAVVGPARDLAIAPWSYRHSRCPLNAGLAGPRPALARATAGRAHRSGTITHSCPIMPSDGDQEERMFLWFRGFLPLPTSYFIGIMLGVSPAKMIRPGSIDMPHRFFYGRVPRQRVRRRRVISIHP